MVRKLKMQHHLSGKYNIKRKILFKRRLCGYFNYQTVILYANLAV